MNKLLLFSATLCFVSFAIPKQAAGSSEISEVPRETIKRNIHQETFEPRKFISFIKERRSFNYPAVIASDEADALLQFIEKQLSLPSGLPQWAKYFIADLKQGNGNYLKITNGIYIIHLTNQFWIAEIQAQQFKHIGNYAGDVVGDGFLADGTHWILVGYEGAYGGAFAGQLSLITYIENIPNVNISGTVLVASDISYSDRHPARESDEYWCGSGPDTITEVSKEILGYEWKDIHKDGQSELIISVEEKDCSRAGTIPVKRQRVFMISKGQINEIK